MSNIPPQSPAERLRDEIKRSGQPAKVILVRAPDPQPDATPPVQPTPDLATQFPALNRALLALAAGTLEAPAPHDSEPRSVWRRSRRGKFKSRRAKERQLSLERHQRKCVICHHPDRDEIEELFLNWHQPHATASLFEVSSRSLYRHAHATGLYAARQGNLRSVLDRILEDAERAKITGDCIIRAVRAYTCLTDNNKWVEPPTRVIVSSQHRRIAANASSSTKPVTKRKPHRGGVRGKRATVSNRHSGD